MLQLYGPMTRKRLSKNKKLRLTFFQGFIGQRAEKCDDHSIGYAKEAPRAATKGRTCIHTSEQINDPLLDDLDLSEKIDSWSV